MKLCDKKHEEVCYDGKHCPMCELIDELSEKIDKQAEEIEDLGSQIFDLESELKSI